ncbi:MAG: 50S ribosomal protein L13 [Gammaproteobacteria bacterium RIFCSPHIGHO2_12_FULL_41_15]|nr:MAG: 50S ribosomal protein L13 [Gammaproteobacteria bacterium RIFCSPHIGHO2_12_FULL_41_15]
MKTYVAKQSTISRGWYQVDASDKVLGRLATVIAHRLRGKHKPEYTPFLDTGDYIVVTNVEKIRVTGKKAQDKQYHRHSGYMGGLKTESFEKLQARKPADILRLAVKGMLPRGPLGREMLTKLKIFAGSEHSHSAQQPQLLEIEA